MAAPRPAVAAASGRTALLVRVLPVAAAAAALVARALALVILVAIRRFGGAGILRVLAGAISVVLPAVSVATSVSAPRVLLVFLVLFRFVVLAAALVPPAVAAAAAGAAA